MTNKWIVVGLALVVGFVGGMLVGKHKSGELDGHKGAMSAGHAHTEIFEVPAGAAVPTVDLVVHKDPKSGYNAQIITTNFRFAPESASTEAVLGEGHAHIYVDDKKINRVYGNWYHLGTIGGVGDHEVRVELSANDHSAYAVNGKVIEVTKTVTVEPAAKFDAAAAKEHSVAVEGRTLSPEIVEVTQGDSVRLVVSTDEVGEFHVAGYEIEKEMDVDGTIVIEFVADMAGRYNLELHPAMVMEMEKEEGHMEGEMHMDDTDHGAHEGEDIEIGALIVNPK